MKIEIINQQKIKKINSNKIHRYLEKVLSYLNISSKKVSIFLCDNRRIRELNREYFKKNSSTDVISFPLADAFEPDYLGEVVVSVEESVKVADKLKVKWEDELFLYLIHGILHLLGYDDRTKRKKEVMEKKQEEVLREVLGGNLKI